ncbi:uncharacterized protein LOC135688914 [Rhopilema esculentum]|uniref:uncharacterized protein LOC135688914 n=1 Tax=Rhopilema esculentum TaxID=499914 RepID=UPI0031DD7D66
MKNTVNNGLKHHKDITSKATEKSLNDQTKTLLGRPLKSHEMIKQRVLGLKFIGNSTNGVSETLLGRPLKSHEMIKQRVLGLKFIGNSTNGVAEGFVLYDAAYRCTAPVLEGRLLVGES